MKRIQFCLFALLLFPLTNTAQITTDPPIVTETGAVKIIFDATKGNKGLEGYTGNIYAHTGVITQESTNGGDWKHAPSWGDNSEKYKLTSLGGDLWQLLMTPDIRTYYGVSDDEKILKLAFVFRSEDMQKEGKGDGDTDIFVSLNQAPFIPSSPENKERPEGVKEGINYIDDSTVTLVVYAPGKEHLHLLGDFNDWEKSNNWQLYKDADYWWITVSDLEKGEKYAFQYLVDNQLKIADAYAEKILDPFHDDEIPTTVYPDLKQYPNQTEGMVSVLQTGKTDYAWEVTDFAPLPGDQLVVYELLIRDFTEEGTVKAAAGKLDYLKALGVNAIELMPIQEFDGNDSWGYNPCFYFAADKAYGTPDDYKAFIDEAHRLGIAVILDVVFNHATSNNPFARLYWDGSSNKPSADNPWFNIDPPHPYNVFNDFNHEYEGTRSFFKEVLSYWLTEYKVDGFRFDLTKGFTQNISTESTVSVYDASRIAILKEYHEHIKSVNPEAYTILEHFCEDKEERKLADEGMFLWNNMNEAYCQTAMGYSEKSSMVGGSATSRGWDTHSLITYQESHDEERIMYKAQTWGIPSIKENINIRIEQAALNAAFLLCTPGPKMIWQFGELGYDYSIDENGRTGCKPVRWDYLDEHERSHLYAIYSMLLNLREDYPDLFSDPEKIVMQTDASDWKNGRYITLQKGGDAVVLAGNFTDEEIQAEVNFPLLGNWTNLMSTASVFIPIDDIEQPYRVNIAPHSFNLYVRNSKTSNDFVKTEAYKIFTQGKNVVVESVNELSQVNLYSFAGALCKTVKPGFSKNRATMDISGIKQGIYLVTARINSGKIYSSKVWIH